MNLKNDHGDYQKGEFSAKTRRFPSLAYTSSSTVNKKKSNLIFFLALRRLMVLSEQERFVAKSKPVAT